MSAEPGATSSALARTRRTRLARAAAVTLLVATITAAIVWLRRTSPPDPLPPGWTALVSTVAGGGSGGPRDGGAPAAGFGEPFDVAVGPDGSIYISDGDGAHRVRRVYLDGRVETLAGGARGFLEGKGAAARFDTPSAITIDARGDLLVADTGNHAIRRVAPDGTVTTLAGDGTAGTEDGRAARFNGPVGIAVAPDGRVIVADTYSDRIRAVGIDGVVSTVAGGAATGFQDGPAAVALFDTPSGVDVAGDGAIYVADTGNGAVRRIGADGQVTTLLRDLEGTPLRPVAVAVGDSGADPEDDRQTGVVPAGLPVTVYVADERGRILAIDPSGAARTLAGSLPGYQDGAGTTARFRRPSGLAALAPAQLLVADSGNALIRSLVAKPLAAWRIPPSPLIRPRFDAETFGLTPLVWPVTPMEGPHEIAGTHGEARGGAGSERFHAGVDVRVDEGTLVHAVRNGTVTSPVATGDFGTLNEWLRIGPITYVHVRAGRTRAGAVVLPDAFSATRDARGEVSRIRVRRGTRISAGDPVGSVNPFNHVHLNVGWPGEEENPLQFRLTHHIDTIAPTIASGGVQLFDEQWQPITPARRRAPLVVSGRVRIVVDAWDQSDGNRPSRRLGLYALGYQVLTADGVPVPDSGAPGNTLVFDRLAVQPDAARIVYAPGSGIPFYGGRRTRFLYVVTNTLRDGVAEEGFWDTTALAPGRYRLRVRASDVSGNETTREVDVQKG